MWQTARHDVRELDAALRREQRAETKEWFLKVSQGNAGGLHRVTKVVTLQPRGSPFNKQRGSPLAIVEDRTQAWEKRGNLIGRLQARGGATRQGPSRRWKAAT